MIEIPEHCKRLVNAYKGQGYTLVQSRHPDLLRMELGFTEPAEYPFSPVYILTTGRQPLSLVNRDPKAAHILSTGNPVTRNRITARGK